MSYLEEIKTKYDIKDYTESKVVVPTLPTEGIVLIVGTSGSAPGPPRSGIEPRSSRAKLIALSARPPGPANWQASCIHDRQRGSGIMIVN